jgi:hypothetical protein
MGQIFHNPYAIAHGEAVRHFHQFFLTKFPLAQLAAEAGVLVSGGHAFHSLEKGLLSRIF